MYTGAQIIFGDLTPYLSCACSFLVVFNGLEGVGRGGGTVEGPTGGGSMVDLVKEKMHS
jgi:hypothetical protein